MDLELDIKSVGVISSFFKKRKIFCGEGKNVCIRGLRRKVFMCDVVLLVWDEIESCFVFKVLGWGGAGVKCCIWYMFGIDKF